MKKRKNYVRMFLMLMGLLMLFGTGMTVSAETALIDGVEYVFYSDGNRHSASAFINKVRSDHLPTELYIPRKITYKNVNYKVRSFWWEGPGVDDYMESDLVDFDTTWKQNIVIPDKDRSYQACLKKITFARGVKVCGAAYGYEQLKQVVLEDPNDLVQALFNNCPKLKRLHIPAGLTSDYNYDIKNCPSLKVTIDKNNKRLKMIGKDIRWKHRPVLVNVVAGKKNYKVPKGIKAISQTALWGDTAIEKIDLRKAAVSGIEGVPNLKRVKADKNGNGNDTFYWNRIAYCPSLKRIDIPESVQYIYTYNYIFGSRIKDPSCFAPIKDVYLYSKNLKGGRDLEDIPAETTFHVRNKKVAKQLRKFGFKGGIVVEKSMRQK